MLLELERIVERSNCEDLDLFMLVMFLNCS